MLSLSFSSESKYVATATGDLFNVGDQTACVWRCATGGLVMKLHHPKRVTFVSFSPAEMLLATCSYDRFLRLWNPKTGRCLTQFRYNARVTCIAFAPDGRSIAAGSIDRTARIWSVDSGECRGRLPHHTWVDVIEYSPDGKYIATATSESAVLWDAETGQQLRRIRHDSGVSNPITVSRKLRGEIR